MRVKSYTEVWESRCYPDGIPDSLPEKVMKSMRAPSYKAIALCLLNNDLALYGLGFQPLKTSEWYYHLKNRGENRPQLDFFKPRNVRS